MIPAMRAPGADARPLGRPLGAAPDPDTAAAADDDGDADAAAGGGSELGCIAPLRSGLGLTLLPKPRAATSILGERRGWF